MFSIWFLSVKLYIWNDLFYWKDMKLQLYSSENFERGPRWYVVFSTVVVAVLVLSLFNHNIVGAVLLFFLLWGYFYYSIASKQDIVAEITDDSLVLGSKTYSRNGMKWYVLEVDRKTQKLKNIVFLFPRAHSIHSFHDSNDAIKQFILALDGKLPMLANFEQSFLQKLARIMKL